MLVKILPPLLYLQHNEMEVLTKETVAYEYPLVAQWIKIVEFGKMLRIFWSRWISVVTHLFHYSNYFFIQLLIIIFLSFIPILIILLLAFLLPLFYYYSWSNYSFIQLAVNLFLFLLFLLLPFIYYSSWSNYSYI